MHHLKHMSAHFEFDGNSIGQKKCRGQQKAGKGGGSKKKQLD